MRWKKANVAGLSHVLLEAITALVECALTFEGIAAVVTLVYGRLTAHRLPITIFKFNV